MEQILAYDVWALSVVVACCVGWLLGAMRTGSQPSNLEAEENCALDQWFPLKVPPKIVSSTPNSDVGASDERLLEHREEWTELLRPILRPVESERPNCEFPAGPPHCRRSSFEGMPPLEEIRTQAHRIRADARLWDSPDIAEKLAEFLRSADTDSVDVLVRYRKAIGDMQRFTESGSPGRCETGQPPTTATPITQAAAAHVH